MKKLVCTTFLLLAACAPGPAVVRAPRDDAAVERGLASYYADSLEGRKTANGERYDHDRPTCAHRTHAFGTELEVRAVASGAKVRCRVNDRGPFVKGRVVDVSKSLAQALGMVQKGVIEVEVRRR